MKPHTLCLTVLFLAATLATVGAAHAAMTYPQEVLADNPLIYYRLNETGVVHTSTAVDSSPTGLPGTYLIMGGSGGAFTDVASAYPALSPAKGFDGSHTEIFVPTGIAGGPPSVPQFSMEFWMKPNNYNPGLYAIYAGNGWGNRQAHLNLSGANLELAVDGNSGWGLTNMSSVAPVGQWSHVVVTHDSATASQKVYVNGLLVSQPAAGGTSIANFSVDGYIGSWNGNDRFYSGGLDEMAFYTGILPASRVAAHYNTAKGFQLVETGGPFSGGNVARNSAGATAFGKDVLGGTHTIAEVNDGLFGNESSWIGATIPSFVGVAFSGSQTIDHIGWGRSNTQSHTDRDEGTYTIQYTQVASPGVGTLETGNPATGWATLATAVYDAAWPSATHLRHLYRFPSVSATGVRIVTQSTGAEIAIDEIEAYLGHPLTLIQTGGTFDTNPARPNLARRPGATAFAPDSFGAPHSIAGLNDGVYGNSNSWIGTNPDNTFAGVALGGLFPVDRVAFGRDNLGALTDRTEGTYTLQYTQVANPSALTPDGDWTTIGTLIYPAFYQNSLRHMYEFSTVYATGFRLVLDAADNTRQIAIDEFEIYQAIPEPSTWVLGVLGASLVGMAWGRRRRAAQPNPTRG